MDIDLLDEKLVSGLCVIGVVGIADPLREEVPHAVK